MRRWSFKLIFYTSGYLSHKHIVHILKQFKESVVVAFHVFWKQTGNKHKFTKSDKNGCTTIKIPKINKI